MHKLALCLLCCLTGTTMARAYEQQRALDNMAEDVSACVAFYIITINFAKANAHQQHNKGWANAAEAYMPTLQNAIQLLRVTMASKPQKFMDSKIDLRMQEQMKILKNEGMDRLIALHLDACKTLMEHPDQRLKYWTEKE